MPNRRPSLVALTNAQQSPLAEQCTRPRTYTQWSSPALLNRRLKQILFPGGDGWLRSLDPAKGKLLWKFDCNPKDAIYELNGRGTRNEIVGVPVVHEGRIYIGTGHDPEHGDGVGHLWCIDPAKPKTSRPAATSRP